MSRTRKELSLWNKEHFGDINNKVNNLQKELNQLQEIPQSSNTEGEIIRVNNDLNKWHKIKSEFYQQKERDQFIKYMDTNNKFFHTKVNKRRVRNNIDVIQDHNNNWLQTRDQIAQHLTHHFKIISTTNNPVIDDNFYSIIPSIITAEQNVTLTRIPSSEDIFSTLKSMENWSSSGQEGFQADFYKSLWETVGEDVCNVAAYVSGRLISDNTVLAQEIIHSMKKKSGDNRWMAPKLDMSKAFDRLECPFFIEVLSYFGFNDDFCDLVQQCINITQLSVMLNGSPCEAFTPTRGIMQGDPLSPYLFILAMEFLSGQLIEAQQDSRIKGIKVVSLAPAINHLLFADDCLIFTQDNVTTVNNLLELLQHFSSQSGQVITFEKSAVYFIQKTKPEVANTIKQILGVKSMNSKEKYLGSPLIIGHSKQESFKSIKEIFERKFNTWSSISLSQAGRGTMIKHVLNAVPIYQMGTFKLPSNLLRQLTAIERKFFGGHHSSKGHNPTTWMSICRPTEMGGLAFRDLEKLNLALLTKLPWRICSESDTLMDRTLSSKYFNNGDLLHQNITAKNRSYVWNGISKGLKIVQHNYFIEINNGRKTKIWRDRWIIGMLHPPSPQNDHYRFYETVEELMVLGTSQWNTQLISFLFDADTALKIQALFIDSNKEDNMIWMPAKDGVFSYIQTKDDKWLYTLVIGAWILWKDRCDVVFQGVTLNPFSSICKIHYHLASHMHESYTAVLTNSNISRWKPPLESILKYNTYGSFDSDSNQFGTGIVLRNSTSSCIGTKGTYGNGALSPEDVECMDIREALLW
ncbi:uncharacterized protein LOC113291010 [Papaver somniferum]|uniref:uncharacterized protein LOC113291010 n=1 Tax=Papaver somniferum TaxID=3469 RepID=UPI000E6F5C57|nr:uncharacterized protein LOC113291010 [Papaver somniferum]